MLGIDQDLQAFYRMASADAHLAPLVVGLRGLHVFQTASVFETLVLAILGQQISTHVAHMLRTLLIETYGDAIELEGGTFHAFPRPEALVTAGVEGLRAIKFSTRKSEYIVEIARGVVKGSLDLEGLTGRPADEVVAYLTAIRGVGPWTAQWLLIRALGQPDGFPHGDLALQRFLGRLSSDGPVGPGEALERSAVWSPYRSYVTTYLFAASRSGGVGVGP